jgi:triosephosphate isomerase (TIM)
MGFKADIATSAEDVSVRSGFGAYTGELSAQLLMDSGITWALTGHSERRDGFNAPVY